MVAKVNRPAGQKDQKSFFSSRYFTVILTVGSLVLTGLVGGLFEYLGGQLAQNAATSADPFDNPQVDVFTEWRNRPDFIKLRAEYNGEGRSFSFWDIGYWVDEVEGKIVGGENKYRFKYEENPTLLEDSPWHWEVNLSDPQFQKLNEQYLSDGFKLYQWQEFIGTDGKNRNQAIWRFDPQHVSDAPKSLKPQSKDMKVEAIETASSDLKKSNIGRPEYIVSAIGKAGFDALDKDGDGLMSFAEYPGPEKLKKSNPSIKLRFDKKDRNQDGSLSFKEWFQTRLFTHWYIDHNRDGVVSQAEYLREHEGMDSGVTGEAKAYFEFKDKDGNGELDEAEWMAGKQRALEHWWKQFDRWWEENATYVYKGPDSKSMNKVHDSYTVISSNAEVSLLVDSTGFAYVRESDGEPVAITRSDDYWQGAIPLTRGNATLVNAARDELGRLRVLDQETNGNLNAWVLSDSGVYLRDDRFEVVPSSLPYPYNKTSVTLLRELNSGRAYVYEPDGFPIEVTRSGWDLVPIDRRPDGFKITAATRDELGRLRVLDENIDGRIGAWIHDDKGAFVGATGFWPMIESKTGVWLLGADHGRAWLLEPNGEPIAIVHNYGDWRGPVPLIRGDAKIMGVARDTLGRLRVLDQTPEVSYVWILDDSGKYVGEDRFSTRDMSPSWNGILDTKAVVEKKRARELDLGTTGRTILVQFRTRKTGTLISSAPPTGEWTPNGKSLFLRDDELVFDVGFVGDISGKANIRDGKWHIAAVVVGNDKIQLFVDGKLIAMGQEFNSPYVNGHVFKIGSTATNFGGDFDGDIRWVRVYQGIVSGEELPGLALGKHPHLKQPFYEWNSDNVR